MWQIESWWLLNLLTCRVRYNEEKIIFTEQNANIVNRLGIKASEICMGKGWEEIQEYGSP